MAEHEIILNEDEYPSNSNKSKIEEKKKEDAPVISSIVTKAKPSFFRRAAGVIFSDISEEDLRSEIIFGYLVPTIKDTVVDMGKMLLDAIFYGSAGTTNKRSHNGKPYRTSYDGYYDKPTAKTTNRVTSKNFDDYIFKGIKPGDAMADAEETLDFLQDVLAEYGTISVLDFCDHVGLSTTPEDNNYGWTDMRGFKAVRLSAKECRLEFPPVKLIVDRK